MHKDGYSNAEVGILENEARKAARKNYEYVQDVCKQAEKSEAFTKGLNKLSEEIDGVSLDEDLED